MFCELELSPVRISTPHHVGRDGALRRPRRVQRRNIECDSHFLEHSFSPLNAGWDGAARHPYLLNPLIELAVKFKT
jgi:hypothetical protein